MKRAAHIVVSALLSFFCAGTMHGVEPSTLLSQYGHTAWHREDELSNAAPNAITQTPDGYMWIGTETGLLRFDGVRFVPWTPPHWEGLSDHDVHVLHAASDGTLWIGTPTNLAAWKNGVLTVINTNGPVYVNAIAEDRDHTIWFSSTRRFDHKGVCRVSGATTQCFGAADGMPLSFIGGLTANADGSLSVTSSDTVADWSPARGLISAVKAAGPNNPSPYLVASQSDGSKLVGFAAGGKNWGLQRLTGSRWSAYTKPGFDGSTLSVQSLCTDRHGVLWIGSRTDGIFKVSETSVDRYDKREGLSGNSVRDIYEDREGSLWIATENGIDRFRDLKVLNWSTDQGLQGGHIFSVLATSANNAMVTIDHTLSVVGDGKVSLLPSVPGMPDGFFGSMVEDSRGRYWIGGTKDLFLYDGHRFTALKRPDGQPIGQAFSLSLADDGSVWALVYNKALPRELLHFRDYKVIESIGSRPFGLRVVADHAGGAWINGQGNLSHFAHGQLDRITLQAANADTKNFSVQEDLAVSPDGTVYLTSRLGLWVIKQGKARLADVSAGLPCQDVSGLALSQQRSLWVRSTCGLIAVDTSAIDNWWSHPENKLNHRLIPPSEGARPSRTVFFPQMSVAPDGRIWIGNDSGVQVLDPSHMPFNSLPPPVHIEEVVADRQSLTPAPGLRIHPRTRDLEIRYTALSLAAPQSIKFKYMLEGRDSGWRDPGSLRSAFYSDLEPRHYRFRVIASNNDGVWNNEGDSLDLYIQPAWFQTIWARAIALVLLGAMIWSLYRWRVHSVANAINARFNERLEERTRLAREIHDTLLQTVQGSKMVADHALNPDADETRMRNALEGVSGWLEQAITEGRAAVQALRASTTDQDELAVHLDALLKEHCGSSSLSADLTVTGEPRTLHPIVQDELSLIAQEAVRNVCVHSGATELHLAIQFGDDLLLAIRDNGVGIDPDVLSSGRAGHFGLQSMKERGEKIHAEVDIRSEHERGTEVSVRVPNKIAYKRDDRPSFGLGNILRFQRRTKGRQNDGK